MGYAGVLGPLFVLIPFAVFYALKRNRPYFATWRIYEVLALIVFDYIFILLIAYLVLSYIVYLGGSLIAFQSLASLIFWNILFSAWNTLESTTCLEQRSLKVKLYSTLAISLSLGLALVVYSSGVLSPMSNDVNVSVSIE